MNNYNSYFNFIFSLLIQNRSQTYMLIIFLKRATQPKKINHKSWDWKSDSAPVGFTQITKNAPVCNILGKDFWFGTFFLNPL